MPRRASSLPKKWSHGLCDCCEDPSLSCAVCFCECSAVGQMFERATQRRGACLIVSSFLWILFVVSQVISDMSAARATTAVTNEMCAWWGCTLSVNWSQVTAAQVLGSLAGFFGMITTIVGTYVVCVSRRRVRERDAIPGSDCGDCCTSFWCGCCSLVQILRQERVTGATYRPCTATAV